MSNGHMGIPLNWMKDTCDRYVTFIVNLHKTPVYPSLSQPLDNACYVMITVDRGSTSMTWDLIWASLVYKYLGSSNELWLRHQ